MDNRFNLLLVDHEEYLLETISIEIGFPEVLGQRKEKGKLYLCTRSLILCPKNVMLPILYIPFKAMGSDRKPFCDKDLIIQTNRVILMKIRNQNMPYKTNDGDYMVKISFLHSNIKSYLPLIQLLWNISQQSKHKNDSIEKKLLEPTIRPRLDVGFDKSKLIDFREKSLIQTSNNILIDIIKPLINIPSCLYLTNLRLYIQPVKINNVHLKYSVDSFNLSEIQSVFKRRYMLQQSGIEVILKNNKSILFSFHDIEYRDLVYNAIMDNTQKESDDIKESLSKAIMDWQNNVIGNFEYLQILNRFADRTKNDLTQYPVYPWVLKDYESEKLDFGDDKIYRDLSKPIGALNKERLEKFKQRYELMKGNDDPPPFLYGTHYSTPGYVLFYLVRKFPDLMLKLQNGSFDKPERLFSSIADTFDSVLNNPADIKELIPEFYDSDGSFLINSQHLDLGKKQSGERVNDVKLPPWAENEQDFVKKMRQALESNYVSNHLHEWIDLIFGYKQQGKYAIEYDNLFYYLTYEGAVDFSSIPKDQHESILVQIYEFGQTPKQLFRKPHPCRKIIQEQDKGSPLVKLKSSPIKEVNINEDDKMFKLDFGTEIIKESSFWDPKLSLTTRRGVINISSTKVHRFPINDICLSSDSKTLYAVGKDSSLSFISLEDKENPSVLRRIKLGKLSLSCCELFKHDDNHLIIGSWDNCLYLYSINYGRIVQKINGHDDAVSCIEQGDNLLVTGSWDSSIKVWDIEKSINLSQEPINAFYDHNQEISCLSLQNSLLISGGKDNMVYLNDLRVKNMNTAILKLNAENVKQVKFVSDRKVLICTDNGIKLFDVSSKELTSKLEFNDNTIINGFVTDNKSIILNTSAENRLTYGKVYGLSEIMDEQLTGKANPVSLNKVEENEFTKMIASPKGDLIVNSYKNGMFSILY